MKGLLLLFTFMTRIPVPAKIDFDSQKLGKSLKFFPVVGLVIGLILSFIYCLIGKYLVISSLLIAVILVLVEVILTGALHLDGLSDTFDSIFSYRSKQKMLDIMKDSRIGANGAIALIMYFLLKVILLSSIIDLSNTFLTWNSQIGSYATVVILITPMLARINPVLNAYVSPYAKASGSAKDFAENTNKLSVLIAVAISLIFSVVVGTGVFGVLNPLHLVNIVAITMALGLYYSKLIDKKIGGLTGDTLGALLELSDIIILFGFYISCVYSLNGMMNI